MFEKVKAQDLPAVENSPVQKNEDHSSVRQTTMIGPVEITRTADWEGDKNARFLQDVDIAVAHRRVHNDKFVVTGIHQRHTADSVHSTFGMAMDRDQARRLRDSLNEALGE